MNRKFLNTVNLDGGVIIKKSGGGGNSGGGGGDTPSRPSWTGHADAEGLKAIGWTDEDIAYYQEHGVNWNAEDDEYHKVTEDNKALYGVLTANNISTYKDRIVYLPKIEDFYKYGGYQCNACANLKAIPCLDISSFSTSSAFYTCRRLTIARFTGVSTAADNMFVGCLSIKRIEGISIKGSATNMMSSCCSLEYVNIDDMSKVTNAGGMFADCFALQKVYLNKLAISVSLSASMDITKESLLYIINNEAATSAISIQLHSYAYNRLSNDADIVAALANHPNISISQ